MKKGDVIGTVTYSYADQELATVNLVAGGERGAQRAAQEREHGEGDRDLAVGFC